MPGYLSPAEYNVTFYGLATASMLIPVSAPVPVYANTTTVVTVNPVQEGSLRIETSPAVDAIVYVNGTAMDPWGDWVSLAPGSYKVSFQNLTGLFTLAPTTVSVTAGATTVVTGYYNNGTTHVTAAPVAGQFGGGLGWSPGPASEGASGPGVVAVFFPAIGLGSAAACLPERARGRSRS